MFCLFCVLMYGLFVFCLRSFLVFATYVVVCCELLMFSVNCYLCLTGLFNSRLSSSGNRRLLLLLAY